MILIRLQHYLLSYLLIEHCYGWLSIWQSLTACLICLLAKKWLLLFMFAK